MTFIDTEVKRKRLQQALKDNGFDIGPDGPDGYLGGDTARAIINARIAYKLDHQDKAEVDTDLMRELGLLTIQDPVVIGIAKARGLDLIGILKLISTLQALSKGNLMDGSKPWYLSQTIIANLLAGLGVVLTFFHVDFGAADQASLVTAIIEIATGGSLIWGIIGRLLATKTIGAK